MRRTAMFVFGRVAGTKERANPSQRETIQVSRKEALSVLWVPVGGRNSPGVLLRNAPNPSPSDVVPLSSNRH